MIGLLLAGAALFTAWFCADWIVNAPSVRFLSDTPREPDLPPLSIIVAARDEAAALGTSVATWLSQNYPDLEIIVVDDRSTDGTTGLLKSIQDKRLRVVRVDSLPEGWLGKPHALQRGVRETGGRWLLFVDADVRLHPEAAAQAVSYALREKRDHVTAFPDLEARSVIEEAVLSAFALLMTAYARPWRLKDPSASDAIGIGAFNLIRREAYEAVGTHEAMRMCVIDDVRLGQLVKKGGFASDAVIAGDRVAVRWHDGPMAIIRGLEKNAFAGAGFSLTLTTLAVLGLVVVGFVPLQAALFGEGLWRFVGQATLLGFGLIFSAGRRFQPASWKSFALVPAGLALVAWALARSAFMTLKRKGLVWRGTFYPLSAFQRPTWGDVGRMLLRKY